MTVQAMQSRGMTLAAGNLPAGNLSADSAPPTDLASQIEPWRHLLVRLRARDGAPQTLGLTPCNGQTDALSCVVNLGVAAALAGDAALLVEGAFHEPRLHEVLNIPGRRGLRDVLKGKGKAFEYLTATELPHLHAMPAGAASDELLNVDEMRRLQEWLALVREEFSLVIVHVPAAQRALALQWAGLLDGMALVLPEQGASVEEARQTRDTLQRAGARLAGAVLHQAY